MHAHCRRWSGHRARITRRRISKGAGQDLGAINELLKSFKGMKTVMKEMNKLGLGARMGLKEKKEALRGLSPDGDLLASGPGALDGLFGGGNSPALPPGGLGGLGGPGGGLGGLGGLFGGGRPPRPMGSSATRQSGSKRKKDKKRKKRR